MIVRKLVHPESFPSNGRALVFPDHTLFTGTLTGSYGQPRFTAGPGIFTVLAGSARCTLNNKKETLDKGKFLLINHGSQFSFTLSQPGVQPLFLFFHTRLIHEILKRQNADLTWLERTHPLQDQWQKQLEWITKLGNSCASFSMLKADSLIRSWMDKLIAEAQSADLLSRHLPVTKRTTRIDLFQRLSRTREWIQANYSAPVTLDDMAAVASVNSQHFLRLFRECYGITPHRFLTNTRLEAARQLLLSSSETVSDVCRQTGFESFSSFSGLFRLHFGQPPSVYRIQDPAKSI